MTDELTSHTAEGSTPRATPPEICAGWYGTYGDQLYRYLRFHVSSPDLAEDLTAEVFLRALRHMGRFDPAKGSPRAWLFRIAQNALRDHRRQSRRRQVLSLGDFRDLEFDGPSPEERVLWADEVARLLEAMAGLSADDQQIISLCYGADLSLSEAGEIIGISGPAARTRLWRALRRLKVAVHDAG